MIWSTTNGKCGRLTSNLFIVWLCFCFTPLCPFVVSQSLEDIINSNIRVEVLVAGENSSEIESFVKRELRSIGDVDIVDGDENPEVIVSLVSVSISVNERDYGISLSTVFMETFNVPMSFLGSLGIDSLVSSRLSMYVDHGYRSAVKVSNHKNWVLPKNEIRDNIQRLVAELDTELLDLLRQERREKLKLLDQY